MNPSALIDAILSAGKHETIVRLDESRSVNVRWANSTTTTNGAMSHVSASVVAIVDGRVGTVSQTLSGGEDPVSLVREAEQAAAGTPVAEDQMPLIEGDGATPPDWNQEAADVTPELFAAATSALEAMFATARANGDPTYGYAEHVASTSWLATSAGVRRRGAVAHGQLSFTVKNATRSRSTWAGEWVDDWSRVDPLSMYEAMRSRLEESKERVELPAGRYDVILTPSCVADMCTYLFWLATLRDALDGQSAFSAPGGGTRIGERLTEAPVTIASDPSAPGLAGLPFASATQSSQYSSVFDAGMDRGPVDLVREGTLVNLIAPRAVASRANADPVPMPTNILMAGDGDDLEQMIASTERALLLNALWYIRLVDPRSMLLTGLTRDGVYLVEDGRIRAEVNNFRFNMSPLDMLANVREIGRATNTMPREFEMSLASAPPLRIADWHMSSVSEAT